MNKSAVKIFLAIIFLFTPGTFLAAQTLILNDEITSLSAVRYMAVLEDATRQLTIEQITSPAYTAQFKTYHKNDYINFGRSLSAFWVRFDLQNPTHNNSYLQLDTPGYPRLDAYLLPQGAKQATYLGNMRNNTDYQRLPTLQIPEGIKQFSLYIKAYKGGMGSIYLPFKFLSTDNLLAKTAREYLFFGGIIISLLVLALYNFFLFISLRQSSYLLLSAFLISLILVLQRMSNVIPFLSSLSDPGTFYYHIGFQLNIISGTQFWRLTVNSKKLFPRADRVIRFFLAIAIVTSPFISFLPFPDFSSYPVSLILIYLIGILGLLALRKGPRIMLSLSLALLVFLIGVAPVILWGIGIVNTIETPIQVAHIASLLTGIILSFSLAEHNRQLRLQAEQAKSEIKAKDNFLTTTSHELRTPMYAVTSIVNLLKATDLSDKQQNYIEKLEVSSAHMMALINEILDLSLTKSDEFHLKKQAFELSDLLEEIRQLLTEEANRKQLVFVLDNQTQLDGNLLTGDATRLKQILLNLLFNSIKFTEHGSITLRVSAGQTTQNDGISLTFTVSDTGIGISPDQMQYIFQAFSQADHTNTQRYGGSGLGLTISHKLVTQMGGELKLTSKPGKGSHFFFTIELPLQAIQSTDTQKTTTALPTPEAPNINLPETSEAVVMLVDDIPLNRFLGEELLSAIGINTITAEDGEDAIQQLQHHQVAIVFMDISMPGIDGYETTRRIRADTRLTSLPIIALTAHALVGEKERCLAAGMNDYLSKPFEIDQLREKIRLWTQKQHENA